jgi:membrane protein
MKERLIRGAGPLGQAAIVGRRTISQSLRDDVLGLSAELAYRFFLAIFPFGIFLAALGGFVADWLDIENPAQRAVDLLGGVLPEEAAGLVQSELQSVIDRQSAGLLSLGAVLALFFATGGTNAIIKAMNRAYSVKERRSFIGRYAMAVTLTIVAGAAIVSAFVLLVPVRLLARPLAEALGMGQAVGLVTQLMAGLGALVLVVAAATIVYRVAPNIRLPLRAVLPGAVLFAIGWLVATLGFAFYVGNFADYANTYGALAGVAITLIWFYASALILLVCAEVNEVLHELHEPADVERRRREANARATAEVDQAAASEA